MLTEHDLVTICEKDEVALYAAIHRLNRIGAWQLRHRKIWVSLLSYLELRDKLTDKQLELARKLMPHYALALKELYDAKSARLATRVAEPATVSVG